MAPIYRELAPEALAAGLPEPLYGHFLSGRYRDFEQLASGFTEEQWQDQIEQCLSYVHYLLARAFLAQGVLCCAQASLRKLSQLQPRDAWVEQALARCASPTRPESNGESLAFFQLRHLGQSLVCPADPQTLARGLNGAAAWAGPYISAAPDAIRAWGARLQPWPGTRVGLIWAPSPLSLQAFSCLSPVSDVQFFGLQQGVHQIQARWPPAAMPFADLSGYLNDWASVSGLLHHLDLLISVNHPTAHLAAAMGRPVWMLGECPRDYGRKLRCFGGGDWQKILKKVCTAWSTRSRESRKPLRTRPSCKTTCQNATPN